MTVVLGCSLFCCSIVNCFAFLLYTCSVVASVLLFKVRRLGARTKILHVLKYKSTRDSIGFYGCSLCSPWFGSHHTTSEKATKKIEKEMNMTRPVIPREIGLTESFAQLTSSNSFETRETTSLGQRGVTRSIV